jgi:hypothetical protein
MQNKFVVQVIKSEKWLNLDFHDGSELIYVDKFLSAYQFDDVEQAESFVRRHGLQVEDCELFKLSVYAKPLPWS